jgi:hypothetical protein
MSGGTAYDIIELAGSLIGLWLLAEFLSAIGRLVIHGGGDVVRRRLDWFDPEEPHSDYAPPPPPPSPARLRDEGVL